MLKRPKIYRADIDKIAGWRIHHQYVNGQIHLKDIIDGQHHDDVIRFIQAKKERYNCTTGFEQRIAAAFLLPAMVNLIATNSPIKKEHVP